MSRNQFEFHCLQYPHKPIQSPVVCKQCRRNCTRAGKNLIKDTQVLEEIIISLPDNNIREYLQELLNIRQLAVGRWKCCSG